MKIIYMCLFVVTITSCVSMDHSPEWSYVIQISNEGTRSEGKRGILSFYGEKVPFVFEKITIGKKSYTLRDGPYNWNDKGYFESETNNICSYAGFISQKELDLGWYELNTTLKRLTPHHWIIVYFDAKTVCLDPGKLGGLMEKYQLKQPAIGQITGFNKQ